MAKKKEHRKRKRFQVPEGTFVGIGPEFDKVGPLVDLSMTGLSFRYVGGKEPPKASYVDIFMTNGEFYLGRLPIEPMENCEVVDTDPSTPSTLRRCGVKFGKLTQEQKTKLKKFIEQHTIGEA